MDKIRMDNNVIYFKSVLFMFLLLFGCSDYSKDLGGGYTYMNEGGGDAAIFHQYPSKGGEIPPSIVSYKYDKDYITAKQIPDTVSMAMGYYREYVYNGSLNKYYYWLVIKKDLKILGPLDIDQFNQKRKEYNVPDKLILE